MPLTVVTAGVSRVPVQLLERVRVLKLQPLGGNGVCPGNELPGRTGVNGVSEG